MASLYFSYESNSHPTIHPTVTICILKNLPQSSPHGEDLPYRQFCRWFKFAAHMINRNFEKSRVYFKAVPPLF